MPDDENQDKVQLSEAELNQFLEEDIPEDTLKELNAMFEKFDNPELQEAFKDTELVFGDDDDIDSEIKRLLAAEEQEESKFEDFVDTSNFIEDISVYDSEQRSVVELDGEIVELEEVEPIVAAAPKKHKVKPKKEKKKIVIATKTLYIVASVLFVLVLAMSVTMFTLNSLANSLVRNSYKISIPQNVTNNNKYIYVTLESELGENSLKMTRLLIDPMATEFYFSGSSDLTGFEYVLQDNKQKTYPMDLVSVSEGDLTAPEMMLRFAPFDVDVNGFCLLISDPVSGGSNEFNFHIDGGVAGSLKQLSKRLEVLTGVDDITVSIEGGDFSSSSSTVFFSINWNDNISEVSFDDETNAFTLMENGQNVIPTGRGFVKTVLEDKNMLLGRAEFTPLRSLNSPISINLVGLNRSMKIERDFPVNSLPKSLRQQPYVFDFRRYKTIIECADFQGDYYVLVFHTEDKNIFASSSDYYLSDNRVDTTMHATLILPTQNGNIEIKGRSISGKMGTDMLFDIKDYKSVMLPEKAYVRIDSVDIRMKEVSLDLDMSTVPLNRTNPRSQTVAEVTESFNQSFEDKLNFMGLPIGYSINNGEIIGMFQKGYLKNNRIEYITKSIDSSVK